MLKPGYRKGATIGANATILCGNEIGEYAFIGAGTVVTEPVPAYALYIGNPGKQTGWMSEYGHKLEFDAKEMLFVLKVGNNINLINDKVERTS